MYLHATGTIPDLDKLAPYWPEESRVLAELHAEGVVKNLYRLSDRPGVYLIVEADDVEEARRQVGRPPFVSHGLLIFEFEPVEKLLRGAGALHSAHAHRVLGRAAVTAEPRSVHSKDSHSERAVASTRRPAASIGGAAAWYQRDG